MTALVPDGQIDVGDRRTVELRATDADGAAAPLADARVTVYPPGAVADDRTDDLVAADGGARQLDIVLTVPGRWRIQVESAAAGQVEWFAIDVRRPSR